MTREPVTKPSGRVAAVAWRHGRCPPVDSGSKSGRGCFQNQIPLKWRCHHLRKKARTEPLICSSRSKLEEAFRTLGTQVGPRLGSNRRNKDEKEWWCLRRYLLTLAARDRLTYPIDIKKSERPDFVVNECNRDQYGIEVTEATEEDWQKKLTSTEVAGQKEPDEVAFICKDGFVGEEPEHDWCAVVIRSISDKVGKLNKKVKGLDAPLYDVDRCDLLVYVNSRATMVAREDRAIEFLRAEFSLHLESWNACARLRCVAVLGARRVFIASPNAQGDLERANFSTYTCHS